jgi:hypothetical protein
LNIHAVLGAENDFCRASNPPNDPLMHFEFAVLARRRAAAKRKKLKNLGKSKSTDTEEEEAEEDYGDDGELTQSSMR